MLRKAINRPSRSFWGWISAFLVVVTLSTGYVTYYNNTRQTCVQDFITGAEISCHQPKPGEPQTIFVFNPKRQ